ncbi:fucolectin-like [Rhincodon typus]|uniref:fucolectin-like n=1 Tax=Rhincodon typus TaxID=259920 RepID=UPI002030AB8F|nr:fucolectin-like [Rhincodon typus]
MPMLVMPVSSNTQTWVKMISVIVLVACCGVGTLACGNVALRGNATQSSTNWGGDANKAIDGNRNAFYRNQSCTHTNTDDKPWWSLDLFNAVEVLSIKITNRQDCCWNRLKNAEVRVGLSFYNHGNDNPICGTITGLRAGETKVLNCHGMVGRFINIILKERGILTLCECEVYVKT